MSDKIHIHNPFHCIVCDFSDISNTKDFETLRSFQTICSYLF